VTRRLAVCADVGSTFTKVAVVDLDTGELVSTGAHRTTVETDVLDGLDTAAARAVRTAELASAGTTDTSTVYVCSSAGGGLRLAVVGYEPLVTAEAGHRVGLSAGARVVHVASGRLGRDGLSDLRASRPDVVLLVGGTDGGDAEVLRHNASRLASGRIRVPVVLAGNAEVRDEVSAVLAARGVTVVPTDNVLPRIGELNPQPARVAIREVFLRHVIGGKKLSHGPRFASLVRGATPDLVLTAVELLADSWSGGDLVVVDVGGATTDVYSMLSPDPEAPAGAQKEVAGTLWRSRTVEGDLGMRWSAPGVVAAAVAERLIDEREAAIIDGPARLRTADPSFIPTEVSERAADARLAELAAIVALRRHARPEPASLERLESQARVRRTAGKDLRRVGLLIGSGGVLRYAAPDEARVVLGGALTDHSGGWAVPQSATTTVDVDYVLAPAGLLAADHPEAAVKLLTGRLLARSGEPFAPPPAHDAPQ
jgi:uncharacterized protein (TIGR01319 family)